MSLIAGACNVANDGTARDVGAILFARIPRVFGRTSLTEVITRFANSAVTPGD